jgi:hypothetical protein
MKASWAERGQNAYPVEATLVCGESNNDRRMIMRDSQAEKAERFQALHAQRTF